MAKLNVLPRLGRMFPAIAYHHLIMIVIVFAATVTAILLAGAGSTSIAHRVYLVQFSYLNSKEAPKVPPGVWENITLPAFEAVHNTHLTVRVGYFGLCAKQESDDWLCRDSASSLMASRRFIDPLGVTTMADKVKNDVIFPGFLIGSAALAFISIVLFNTFPGWHEERDEATGSDVDVKPFPSRPVLVACLACTVIGALFTFTSALWQHTASATAATILETSAVSIIKANVGSVGTALAWLIFGIWLIVFLATFVMWLSIRILDRLTD